MKKMNEIRTEVITKLQGLLQNENVLLESVDIVKLNDLFHYGIVFRSGEIGKTLYINDFVNDGMSADEIADEMLMAYENSVDAPPYEMVNELQAKQPLSDVKESLYVALLEVARNKTYLKDIPYQKVSEGLAYICQIRYIDNSGTGSMCAAVTNALVESNGWDIGELFDTAINNTLRHDTPLLCSMQDALFSAPENLLDKNECHSFDLLVLTNASQCFGAATLFLPGVIDKIHACVGGDFFAIPSSMHEIIIVPESLDIGIDNLSAMCREANATVVEQKDILSNYVMHFTRK